jgi:hypothetical protein
MIFSPNPGPKNTKAVSTAATPRDSHNGLIVLAKTNRMNQLKWKWSVRTVACVNHTVVLMKLKRVKKTQMATHVAGRANMLKALKKARMVDKFATVCPMKV